MTQGLKDRAAERFPIERISNYRYAWRNGWRWIFFGYIRETRLIAAVRQVWWVYLLGYIGEGCQFCGRPYPLWHAPDGLWDELMGGPGGLSCIACFDRLARRRGMWLRWTPEANWK